MGKLKYKWKVDPPPVGRYRAFDRRHWPKAEYPDGQIQAFIDCEEDYRSNIEGKKHKPLTLMVFNYTDGAQKRKTMRVKTAYPTIEDCKIKLEELLAQFPSWVPQEFRP